MQVLDTNLLNSMSDCRTRSFSEETVALSAGERPRTAPTVSGAITEAASSVSRRLSTALRTPSPFGANMSSRSTPRYKCEGGSGHYRPASRRRRTRSLGNVSPPLYTSGGCTGEWRMSDSLYIVVNELVSDIRCARIWKLWRPMVGPSASLFSLASADAAVTTALTRSLGSSTSAFSLVPIIGAATGCLLIILFTTDRISPKKYIVWSVAAYAAASLLPVFWMLSPTSGLFIICRAICGAALASVQVAALQLLTESLPPRERPQAAALCHAQATVTSAVVKCTVGLVLSSAPQALGFVISHSVCLRMFHAVLGMAATKIAWNLQQKLPESPRWLLANFKRCEQFDGEEVDPTAHHRGYLAAQQALSDATRGVTRPSQVAREIERVDIALEGALLHKDDSKTLHGLMIFHSALLAVTATVTRELLQADSILFLLSLSPTTWPAFMTRDETILSAFMSLLSAAGSCIAALPTSIDSRLILIGGSFMTAATMTNLNTALGANQASIPVGAFGCFSSGILGPSLLLVPPLCSPLRYRTSIIASAHLVSIAVRHLVLPKVLPWLVFSVGGLRPASQILCIFAMVLAGITAGKTGNLSNLSPETIESEHIAEIVRVNDMGKLSPIDEGSVHTVRSMIGPLSPSPINRFPEDTLCR